MTAINLMIVDDDEIIREGLIKNIAWAEHGLQIVASARHGREGLALAKQHLPQIVISDIRMPFMDGLEMAEKIREFLPEVKIIFLTGYDDFSFAQKAIRLKASSYILKFAYKDQILAEALKASREFEEEQNFKQKLEKSRRFLQDNFLEILVQGGFDEETFYEEAQLSGVYFKGNRFGVAVFRFHSGINENGPKFHLGNEVNLSTVLKVLEEVFFHIKGSFIFRHQNHNPVIIFDTDQIEGKPLMEIRSALSEAREKIRMISGATVTVGVSNFYDGYSAIATAFNEALFAAGMTEVFGKEGIIHIENIKNSEFSQKILFDQILEYIHQNYYKENISLSNLSNHIHLSSNYICILFKKYLNKSFIDYLTKIRMEKAMELLKNTNLKNYEVAEKVGYPNPQYFCVLFKKFSGYSPADFKKQNQH